MYIVVDAPLTLPHIWEYTSEYSEYEALKFEVNSPKNCE